MTFFSPLSIIWRIHLVALVLILLLFGFSCEKKETADQFVPNTGQIQVLNGSGEPGVAEKFRNHLAQKGFDIVEFGNANSWNYRETMVIGRGRDTLMARDLVRVIGTKHLLHLKDPAVLVEATVIIGKDHEELMRQWETKTP